MNEVSPIVVVAGVVRRPPDKRILVSRRHDATHLGGLWEFPGGKVEEGESLEQALLRELEEETGIDARVGSLLLEHTHAYPDRTVRLYFFECALLSESASARAVAEIAWCTPKELGQYPMPEANVPLVALLQSNPEQI